MAVDVEIDVELLKSEIKKTWASVSEDRRKTSSSPRGVPGPKTSATRKSSRTYPTHQPSPSPASQTPGQWAAYRLATVS